VSSQRSPPNPPAGCNGSNFHKGNGGREGKKKRRKDGKGMEDVAASGRGGGKRKGEERKGGGNEEKRKRGGEESWNRVAEWLRPALQQGKARLKEYPLSIGVRN